MSVEPQNTDLAQVWNYSHVISAEYDFNLDVLTDPFSLNLSWRVAVGNLTS